MVSGVEFPSVDLLALEEFGILMHPELWTFVFGMLD